MSNKAVAYVGPGEVEVKDIGYPDLVLRDGPGVNPLNVGRKCEHGVILKIIATNICGEIIEKGRDVEFLDVGDLVSGSL